jgi:hypothetical protein
MQQSFHELVRGQHTRSTEWLDFVNASLPAQVPSESLAS